MKNLITDMDKKESRKSGLQNLEHELEKFASRRIVVERSVMDEASGKALRTQYRRIACLEREMAEWTKARLKGNSKCNRFGKASGGGDALATGVDEARKHSIGLQSQRTSCRSPRVMGRGSVLIYSATFAPGDSVDTWINTRRRSAVLRPIMHSHLSPPFKPLIAPIHKTTEWEKSFVVTSCYIARCFGYHTRYGYS